MFLKNKLHLMTVEKTSLKEAGVSRRNPFRGPFHYASLGRSFTQNFAINN